MSRNQSSNNEAETAKQTEDPVRASRAGDAFHYRWAARRSLLLITPETELLSLVVEGLAPEDGSVDGDSVVDVSEYWEKDSGRKIIISQLKHSTHRVSEEYTLSGLEGAISGFAKIYQDDTFAGENDDLNFQIITNRPVASSFVSNLKEIAEGRDAQLDFERTLKKYTSLAGDDLERFVGSLSIQGSEGDYLSQEGDLLVAISDLLDIPNADSELKEYIQRIAELVLPGQLKELTKVDVFRWLGITDENSLFPAPCKIASIDSFVERAVYSELAATVVKSEVPVLLTAEGGVGKTVAVSSISGNMPTGSVTVVYDCFGAGLYRRHSHARHRPQEAFLQIVNECAQEFLCSVLLRISDDPIRSIKTFLHKLESAAIALRERTSSALLVVVVDAADNAQIAATLFEDQSFVDLLLQEKMPTGVRLVVSARPERLDLLQLPSDYQEFPIPPFDKDETHAHLLTYDSTASAEDSEELWRLTSGNPRVQKKVFDQLKDGSVLDLLKSLGPDPISSDEQIGLILKLAVSRVREDFSLPNSGDFDNICRALANLPPPVPLEVLAAGAGVDESAIRSFVSEIGGGLWRRDHTVQFRDEPTETWFRTTYKNSKEEAEGLLENISLLAEIFPYAAIVIPQLLLEAGQYDQLVEIALNDSLLPLGETTEREEIIANRIKFALTCSLRRKNWIDAAKLALRAGEEFAGEQRKLELFQDHIDLIPLLLDEELSQEIAFGREIGSGWQGIENLYSASILSAFPKFKGDTRSHFRSARNWLGSYLEERDEERENSGFTPDLLNAKHLTEMLRVAFALKGAKGLVAMARRWKPPEFVFKSFRSLISSLVDRGSYKEIEDIGEASESCLAATLAVCDALSEVGRYPKKCNLLPALYLLSTRRHKLSVEGSRFSEKQTCASAILSLAEAALARGLDKALIARVVRGYREKHTHYDITSDHCSENRVRAIRSLALESIVQEEELKLEMAIDRLGFQKLEGSENKRIDTNIQALLPLYIVRATIISGEIAGIESRLTEAVELSGRACSNIYRAFNPLEFEAVEARFSILKLLPNKPTRDGESLKKEIFGEARKIRFFDLVNLLRASFQCEGLQSFREGVEDACRAYLKNPAEDDEPETIAAYYIGMSRAFLSSNVADAKAYFQLAVDSVARFGDEVISRWKVHDLILARMSEETTVSDELCFRITRVVELLRASTDQRGDFGEGDFLKSLARLNPCNTIALLARWADKDQGVISDQLRFVLLSLKKENSISPASCWVFSGFQGYDVDWEIINECLPELLAENYGQKLFDQVSDDFRKPRMGLSRLKNLQEIGLSHSICNHDLDQDIVVLEEREAEKIRNSTSEAEAISRREEESPADGEWAFTGIQLDESGGVSAFVRRVEEHEEGHYYLNYLWPLFWSKISHASAKVVLEQISNLPAQNEFEICKLLKAIPESLLRRPSVAAYWPVLRRDMILNLSWRLLIPSEKEHLASIFKRGSEEPWSIDALVLDGITDGDFFADPLSLFQLASFLVEQLNIDALEDVLDFGLSRFELQLPEKFGEGDWCEELSAPSEIHECLTSLIWSLLGAPRAEICWQAAHVVRRVNLVQDRDLITCLHKRCSGELSRPFHHRDYIPYGLNSLQFFLFAQNRAAKDDPSLLGEFVALYVSLSSSPVHLVVNKLAAELALQVNTSNDGGQSTVDVDSLEAVGVSPFTSTVLSESRYSRTEFSAWGSPREIFLPYEFEEYWLAPLGEIFGMSPEEINHEYQPLLVDVPKLEVSEKQIVDARKGLFENYSHRGECFTSHGDYPPTWPLNFYSAAHAAHRLAAQLIQEKPVVHYEAYQIYYWEEWFQRHALSRSDGYWLSDVVSAFPVRRRRWIGERKTDEDWPWAIQKEDFIDCIRYGEKDLILEGNWSDYSSDGKEEEISIFSRLVSTQTSSSLLRALHLDEILDQFELIRETDFEADHIPPEFQLMPVTAEPYGDPRLDKMDPRSNGMESSLQRLNPELVELMSLDESQPPTSWKLCEKPEVEFRCEVWNENIRGASGREQSRHGKWCRASIVGAQELLARTGRDLAITVAIRRKVSTHGEDRWDYPEPYCNHMLLSEDGKIRDLRNDYRLW